ncbi:MAG: hypothetical protein V1913_14090 [Fibrobacterota bacterium]
MNDNQQTAKDFLRDFYAAIPAKDFPDQTTDSAWSKPDTPVCNLDSEY